MVVSLVLNLSLVFSLCLLVLSPSEVPTASAQNRALIWEASQRFFVSVVFMERECLAVEAPLSDGGRDGSRLGVPCGFSSAGAARPGSEPAARVAAAALPDSQSFSFPLLAQAEWQGVPIPLPSEPGRACSVQSKSLGPSKFLWCFSRS